MGLIVALVVVGAVLGTLTWGSGPATSPAPSASPTLALLTPTPEATGTAAPEPTWSCSPEPTQSASPEPTWSASPAATPTEAPSALPTWSPSPRPSPTPRLSPSPRPSVTPRPTIVPTPTPTPGQGAPSTLVRHGSRTGNDVALTFDMGGRVGDALAIVNWLVDNDVHATIFMTGAMAENPNTDAGRRVLAIIDQNPGLLTLGNHSYTHRDFRNLTAAEIRDELLRTEAAIAPFCDQDLHPFFRPPNGGYDAAALAAIGAAGYRFTVTWDVDTIDWRPIVNDPPGPTADQIVAKVLGNTQGGSIVLMHLGGYETFEALPRIVGGLRAAGFDLVTLDELL